MQSHVAMNDREAKKRPRKFVSKKGDWKNGCMDRARQGNPVRTPARATLAGAMDGWMDGWISDGWMAGLDGIDRWMDEWMDGCETGQPCSHTRKGNPCGRDGWIANTTTTPAT